MDGSKGRGTEEDKDTAGGCHTSYLRDRPLLQDRASKECVCGRMEVDAR